jgi:PAS domain S-box-containing protein
MMLDITDRKRMEETIRQSEERLRLTLKAANTVAWEIKTADGSLDEIGPVDRQFGGTGSAHANVADVVSSIHPTDRDRVLGALASAMRGEGELRVEFRVPQPDGGEKWLEGNGTLIRDAEGRPERLMGVGIDVSERKRAEISLREREQELAAAQRLAKIGSWQWNIRTDEASWSDETFRIFGLPPSGLEKHRSSFVDTIHPDDRARVNQALTDALKGTAEYDLQYRVQCPDGQEKVIDAQGEVLRDADGVPILMRGTVHDITERRQAEAERERLEEQLRQAQKLESIGRLAGGVAHDFNNLLTVINGYSDFLLEQMQEQDPLRSSLVEVRKAGERAADLTRQLLAFSRKQVVEPRPVNLNTLILDSREMLGRVVREDIEIVTELEPNPSEVMADPGRLHQVLLNLVVNARDAMPGGGRLTLRTSRLHLDPAAASLFPGAIPGFYAVLEVSDTGAGMSEEIQQRVFDPFFTTKGPGEGTGLGLSTVYGIVRQAGGWIKVESSPGMGATFRIGLPLAAQPVLQCQSAKPSPTQLEGSETVLVVEDQDEVRRLALSVLRKFGYQTLEARSGPDALSVAESYAGPIHLMLTDMVMPGMTGKRLAEHLRPVRPDMKVVYMSGYTADVITRHGILEPGIEFIEKPFSPGALAQKVRMVLG